MAVYDPMDDLSPADRRAEIRNAIRGVESYLATSDGIRTGLLSPLPPQGTLMNLKKLLAVYEEIGG